MSWLVAILNILLQLLPLLLERKKPTAVDGSPDIKRRDSLRAKVRRYWAVPLLLIMVAGCHSTETIYIPDGTPVRLRETIHDAKVWVLDAEGKPVEGEMDLPAGWFCLPVDIEDGQ